MDTTVTSAPETFDILRDAFETVTEGVGIYDRNERLVYCNEPYKTGLGPLAEMVVPGMNWRTFLRACVSEGVELAKFDVSQELDPQIDAFRASGESYVETFSFDGEYYQLSHRPMPNGGFVITRMDVTERVRAEAEAAHHEALLTRVLETNPIPVVMARLSDSKIVWRSPAAVELVGISSHASAHYYDPKARAEYVSLLKRHGKVEDFRTLCRAADGSVITVALSGTITDFEGETCVVSSITDLTEVLEREALLRQVIEACPAPVLMNRAETGEILYRSPELIALLGEGLDAREFYVDKGERVDFLKALRNDGEVADYRERLYNASGQPFWAAVSGRLTEWNGEEVLVTFTRDLTHQLAIEAELDRQREQMFQNEKMSALGGLLAGVAHELNNPLSVVVGHAMMLREEAPDDNTRRKTAKIGEAAERCARIVKTFLSMARQEPAQVDAVDIDEVLQIAVEVARYGDDAQSVRIERVPAAQSVEVEGDADQLTQVVVNLILNAEQAIAASGKGDLIRIAAASDGEKVTITVEDDGPGIPADIRKRVFEPFFTTKGVGQGTGIGLSVCHRVVSAHNGTIRVDDVAKGGARFTVTLPLRAAVKDAATPNIIEDTSQDRPCRVLIVDDELDVAELNVEVLRRAGYEAQAAFSGEEAIRAIADEAFDVVVSDLNMPGLDGRAVFETLMRDYPSLENGIGFITGDTLGRSSQAFLAEANRPYLEKPVSPRELREFVARLSQKTPT